MSVFLLSRFRNGIRLDGAGGLVSGCLSVVMTANPPPRTWRRSGQDHRVRARRGQVTRYAEKLPTVRGLGLSSAAALRRLDWSLFEQVSEDKVELNDDSALTEGFPPTPPRFCQQSKGQMSCLLPCTGRLLDVNSSGGQSGPLAWILRQEPGGLAVEMLAVAVEMLAVEDEVRVQSCVRIEATQASIQMMDACYRLNWVSS